jgi:hypothetical protein
LYIVSRVVSLFQLKSLFCQLHKSEMANSNNNRFVLFTRDEINQKRENATPINTKRANTKAGRAFRAFLLERGNGDCRVDFEEFDHIFLTSASASSGSALGR